MNAGGLDLYVDGSLFSLLPADTRRAQNTQYLFDRPPIVDLNLTSCPRQADGIGTLLASKPNMFGALLAAMFILVITGVSAFSSELVRRNCDYPVQDNFIMMGQSFKFYNTER